MKSTHVCAAQKNLLILYKNINGTCFLADEIAEPRPDVNIKATAFTESKNFYYNNVPPLVLIV